MLHLEARGELRNLVCFVEKWAEQAEPTPRARLAEARAFLDLKMMDRAWVRLKDLVEKGEGGVEAHVLTARMFVERGWPQRARKPIDLALAEQPDERRRRELEALSDRIAAPVDAVPDDVPESETSRDTLVSVAEKQLATGAFLKAQRLLERARRAWPDDTRIADLLWVLGGDFSLDRSLADLCDAWGPDLSQLADLADEAEHTESVNRDGSTEEVGEPAIDEVDEAAFPSLFRSPSASSTSASSSGTADEPADEDVTQTSPMASARDMHAALARASEDETSSGDTQIVRVIQHKDGAELVAARGPMHKGGDAPPAPFDLASFRREMGMEAATVSESDFEGEVEEEDQDVIVHTRREGDDDETTGRGLEILETDHTTGESKKASLPTLIREEPVVLPAPAPAPEPPKAKAAEPAKAKPPAASPPDAAPARSPAARKATPAPVERRKTTPARSSTPWWILAFGLLLLLLVGVFAFGVLVQIVAALR